MGASGSSGGASGSTSSGATAGASGSGSGGVSGIGNANAGTSAGANAASLGGTGSVAEPRTPTAGVQNKQLQNVKGDHPSVGEFLRFLRQYDDITPIFFTGYIFGGRSFLIGILILCYYSGVKCPVTVNLFLHEF